MANPAPATADSKDGSAQNKGGHSDRISALEALASGLRQQNERMVTIIADLQARLACAETALCWRRTPFDTLIRWPSLSLTAYEAVRDRTRAVIEKGEGE